MQPADLAHLRAPGDLSLSPDGRRIAVAVTRIDLEDDTYTSAIEVLAADGSGTPARFTGGPRDGRPRWSPDGRWLAFTRAEDGGKAQLYVIPADGGEAVRVCEHPLGAGGHVWSPDSTRLAYVARVPEPGRYGTDPDVPPEKEPPRRITTNHYRIDGVGYTGDRRPHIFTVTVADRGGLVDKPEPVQVTAGEFDHGEPAWSPDGHSVAFGSARHDTRDEDLAGDVLIAPASGGDARVVTRTTTTVARPSFSPDGATIYFAGTGDLDVVGRSTGLFAVPADGSEPPRRLTGPEWDIDPLVTAGELRLQATDRDVLTVSLDRGGLSLVSFPLDGGEPRELILGHQERVQVQAYDRVGDTIALVVARDTSAGEVETLHTTGGGVSHSVISDYGGELARSTNLRPMTELRAIAPDGAEVHGWVVKPAGNGPFPVLLNIHGGPHHQYGYALFDEAQVYAGAGYAVVMGNPRGSAGYGEPHGRSIVGDMGNLDQADLLALLDAALADADLDGDRVGVMGGSYGGYMTTWLAAHAGERFRAAISERAVNAWDSMTGSSDIGWFFVDAYTGTDPAERDRQSPLSYADKIDLPMLIIHAEQDWRCPLEQAQRLYVHLKRRGVPVEMLVFPGEGHELSRSGLPSHRVARFEAILEWWARHLGREQR
jgi:dipeptidyl aminopeptidase/acylaminoacyl peptidase